MSNLREVLVALLHLIAGLLKVASHKLVPPEYAFRVVIYKDDGVPIIVREFRGTQERAFLMAKHEFRVREPGRGVLERFTQGRWVAIYEVQDLQSK